MNLTRFLGSRLAALLVAGLCAACSHHDGWEAGAIYSVSGSDGTFGIVKVLARDPGVVSVRLYREKFPARPLAVDPAGLSLGQVGDPEGFGIGHLPLAERDFVLWFPVLVQRGTVSEDELDGYRIWKESGSGVFSSSASEVGDDD